MLEFMCLDGVPNTVPNTVPNKSQVPPPLLPRGVVWILWAPPLTIGRVRADQESGRGPLRWLFDKDRSCERGEGHSDMMVVHDR